MVAVALTGYSPYQHLLNIKNYELEFWKMKMCQSSSLLLPELLSVHDVSFTSPLYDCAA